MPNSDPFRTRSSGDALEIPAAAWNSIIEVVRAYRDGKLTGGVNNTVVGSGGTSVLIRNNSGATRERFDILGVSGVAITYTDNGPEFQNRPCLTGVVPTSDHVGGKFVVLSEPLRDGRIGRGVILGVTPGRVQVDDESATFADAEATQAGRLKAGTTGPVRILWKESGTGEKNALLSLGSSSPGGFFPVKVQQTGGSNGTNTTAASYTYTVRSIAWNGSTGGTTLGTGVAVSRPRMNGAVTVQSGSTGYGTAFMDGSTLVLWDAGEKLNTAGCT